MVPLIGYSDRLSVRPGETSKLKVSSHADERYEAQLVRSICADPNPAGPGIIEEPVEAEFSGYYPSRQQLFYPGSYAVVPVDSGLALNSFTLIANVWPTHIEKGEQAILSLSDDNGLGIVLFINEQAQVTLRIENRQGQSEVRISQSLKNRRWVRLWGGYDENAKELSLHRRHPNRVIILTLIS